MSAETMLIEPHVDAWRKELHQLLDAFPEDAHALHTALVTGAFNGQFSNDGPSLAMPGVTNTCACVIGTVGEAKGLRYRHIAERLYRLGVARTQSETEVLPALEAHVFDIQPGDDIEDPRVADIVHEIELWMWRKDWEAAK